jgi:hypothetical protein
MNPTPDTTAGSGGNFDPEQAAALLDQTTQRARRQLEPSPPWLLTIRAFIALVIYGAVWLSVRSQHPYDHPTAAVIPVLVVLVVVNFVATVTVARRAIAGVSGRFRLRPAEIAAMAAVWVGVFVALGVLAGAGVSHAIVYGIYPVTVQLIVLGTLGAAIAATREDWPGLGVAIAIIVVAAGSAFAGPTGVWLSDGLGCCGAVIGYSAAQAWVRWR